MGLGVVDAGLPRIHKNAPLLVRPAQIPVPQPLVRIPGHRTSRPPYLPVPLHAVGRFVGPRGAELVVSGAGGVSVGIGAREGGVEVVFGLGGCVRDARFAVAHAGGAVADVEVHGAAGPGEGGGGADVVPTDCGTD